MTQRRLAAPGGRLLSYCALGALAISSCAGPKVRPTPAPERAAPANVVPPAAVSGEPAALAAPGEPPPAGQATAAPAPAADREAPRFVDPGSGATARASGPVRYAGPAGMIPRKQLLTFLDTRPAIFLRNVESEPRIDGGRFRGWRIVSFYAGDPRFRDIDLLSGDVVTKVNGLPIEQPDQFIKVWEQVRDAAELRVDMLRNGRPHIARWTIVD